MTNVAKLVEEAKAKGVFDVIEAAKGRGYPTDSVTVGVDAASAYEIKRLLEQGANEKDPEATNEIDAKIEVLKDKIRTSNLTFNMRGISPGMIESITEEGKTLFEDIEFGPGGLWCNEAYLAAHIISVDDAANNLDESLWTQAKVAELKAWLPAESYQAINQLMLDLTWATAYFDASVTADFLSNA